MIFVPRLTKWGRGTIKFRIVRPFTSNNPKSFFFPSMYHAPGVAHFVKITIIALGFIKRLDISLHEMILSSNKLRIVSVSHTLYGPSILCKWQFPEHFQGFADSRKSALHGGWWCFQTQSDMWSLIMLIGPFCLIQVVQKRCHLQQSSFKCWWFINPQ